MKKIQLILFYVIVLCNTVNANDAQIKIEGELEKWHKISLSFFGKFISENDSENPFLNYRLNVTFRHLDSDKVYVVPGFYAADGNSAETSASKGNVWKVRFRPDETGIWTYKVSFRKGDQISINEDINAGEGVDFDGVEGEFFIANFDKAKNDPKAKGRLQYVNERYLQFTETKEFYLKAGTDSPENFLGYYEFDQTPASHKYLSHRKDWKQGDPSWQNEKGKNIIGALNYLASKGMNSVYFLTMNVQGDGNDVWPWNDINERYRFDCSKLDQWEIVFDHMDELGLMLHIVTQETENELLLDIGELGVQRKLYYRELIARFAHHLTITWNLGEENGPVHWSPKGQNDNDRRAMATFIKKTDPYKNFVVLHTHSIKKEQEQYLKPLLGFEHIDGPSMQIHEPNEVHGVTKDWIYRAKYSNKNWVVCQDEIGPADTGAKPDKDDPNHDKIRSKVLWGNLMGGGAGVEWYFGYKYDHNDLNCEDWRSRKLLWEQTKYAIDFFQNYLPFFNMQSADDLTDNSEDYVFAENDNIYTIYLPKVVKTKLNLYGSTKSYKIQWYNPRTGGGLQFGTVKFIKGGRDVFIGLPPDNKGDWVALITANQQSVKLKTKEKNEVIVLEALKNFDTEYSKNKTKYFRDEKNNALMTNIQTSNKKDQYASAITTFSGKNNVYEVSFSSITQKGLESKYVISVNGTIKDTLMSPKTNKDYMLVQHNLGYWSLNKNDIIEVSSAIDNVKSTVTGDGGFSTSGGGWSKMIFRPIDMPLKDVLKDIQPFYETNGFLSVEAEAFHYRTSNGTKRNWCIRSEDNSEEFNHINRKNRFLEASKRSYIEALPDTRVTHDDPLLIGENFFPEAGKGGVVGYKVNITNPGRYYVWSKAFSTGTEDNGVHVGINGLWPESGARMQWCEGKNKWTWSSAQRDPENHCGVPKTIFLDIKKPGEYIILFSMREDGFEMDKWIITTNNNFIPQ